MKKLLMGITLGLSLLCAAPAAQAAPTFVGSYAVYDGPYWVPNPPVYSAREAAALLFGGSPTDYLISIDPSLDSSSITFTGWYDGWGEHDGMIFEQDYKLDLGDPGYNDPAGEGTARSAYVQDGLFDTEQYRNYVWKSDSAATTPEPGSMALLCAGVLPLARKLRRRKQTV